MRQAGGGSSSSRAAAAVLLARRWLRCLMLGPALVIAALVAVPARADDRVIDLTAAEIVLDDSASAPADSRSWKPQPLPDNWNLTRPGHGGLAWYRLRFSLARQPDGMYAVFVRKLSMNAAFY